MFYKKYQYIKSIEMDLNNLTKLQASNEESLRNVKRRIKNGKVYYYENILSNGKTLQKSITDRALGEKLYYLACLNRFYDDYCDELRKELARLGMDSETARTELSSLLKDINKIPHQPLSISSCKPGGLIYSTRRGDLVRSKSEVIIADTLFSHNIDYVYEMPVKNCQSVLPDFTITNNIRGETIYWEHYGLMNQPSYVLKYLKKKKLYESIGIIEGRNLIVTFEFYDDENGIVFDALQAELMVQRYFCLPPGGIGPTF